MRSIRLSMPAVEVDSCRIGGDRPENQLIQVKNNGEDRLSPFNVKAQYVVYMTLIDYHEWCFRLSEFEAAGEFLRVQQLGRGSALLALAQPFVC